MTEIKFRGKAKNGKLIVGDLTHLNGKTYINDICVDPYSIQQFGGYDENGDEVFEGDTVISYGKEYKVKIDFCYGAFHNLKRCRKK